MLNYCSIEFDEKPVISFPSEEKIISIGLQQTSQSSMYESLRTDLSNIIDISCQQ
tara:strand:+ start:161 stop:325 length:165 start_codon:yes stop_codon:yes gene_type:complete